MEHPKLNLVRSNSHVNFEIPKPFCTCGKELSSLFFEFTAKESFKSVMKDIIDDNTMNSIIEMFREPDEIPSDLKFCCKLSLRFGRSYPLSLEDPREGVKKDQPPISLPGALNKRKTIYWSC